MGPIPNALTYGQSLFNFAYTEQQFLADFNRVLANNPNFNLGWAIQNFVYYYGMGFAWPKSIPVAPQVCAYACAGVQLLAPACCAAVHLHLPPAAFPCCVLALSLHDLLFTPHLRATRRRRAS